MKARSTYRHFGRLLSLVLTAGGLVICSSDHASALSETQVAQIGRFSDRPRQAPMPRHDAPLQGPPGVYGQTWETLTPEQKFGSIIESFWVFAKTGQNETSCRQGSQAEHTHCLARMNIKLDIAYPNECQLQLTERLAPPQNIETKWDNRPAQTYALGRSLNFSLRGLDPNLIIKFRDGHFEVFFNAVRPDSVKKKILLSNRSDWITIPTPPMLPDIKPQRTEDERLQLLIQTRTGWLRGLLETYGKTDLPYFSYSQYYSDVLTNDPVSAQRVLAHRADFFLKLTTPNLSQTMRAWFPNGKDISNDRFVDALKSVIAKCQ